MHTGQSLYKDRHIWVCRQAGRQGGREAGRQGGNKSQCCLEMKGASSGKAKAAGTQSARTASNTRRLHAFAGHIISREVFTTSGMTRRRLRHGAQEHGQLERRQRQSNKKHLANMQRLAPKVSITFFTKAWASRQG
jgi:hypothetical protein